MARRFLCALVILGFLAVATALTAAQPGQANPTSPYVQVTLRQQLEKGLKCRRPVEFEFVKNVTDMVDQRKLPLDIVNKSFGWSRKQNSFRPWIYFQQSLIQLAKKQGIQLAANGKVT